MDETLNTTTLNPGEDTLTDEEKKMKALEEAVETDRVRPISFVGKRYYSKDYIDKANKELSKKLSTERSPDDGSAKLAEWLFTYALGHGETLPGCRARLASEYDDHINGVDIICDLTNEGGGRPHVFGIDVCTATLPDGVHRKFSRGDRPRGGIPAGCSFIKFYEDGDYVACLKGVPRFVLGTSPLFAGQQKYLSNFHIEEDGSVSHAPDPDLQFNILSSLFMQSNNLARKLSKNRVGDELVRKRAIETCTAVRLASGRALFRLMGCKEDKDFSTRLNEEIRRARDLKVNDYRDPCYNSIVNECIARQKSI